MRDPTLLDLRGLKCPLPVLRTRRAMRRMPPGAELVVACTDPMAGIDIPHMAREDGHSLVDTRVQADATLFHLMKSRVTPGA